MARIPTSAELGVLAGEMAIFNRRLEELLARQESGRSHEDRKETWVLLSALGLVVMFCFVAFYLGHSEMREMQSGLSEEIERNGRASAAAVERAVSGLRVDRLAESQSALERLMKEKERRDGQRFADLQGEVQRQSSQSGARLGKDLRSISDHLAGLRQLAEEIHQIQVGARPAAGVMVMEKPETRGGWAARAPDGAPVEAPPVPAARPPGQGSGPQEPRKEETPGTPR